MVLALLGAVATAGGVVGKLKGALGKLTGWLGIGNSKWKSSTAANVDKRYKELVALKTPNSVYKKMVAGTVDGPREMFPSDMPWGPQYETYDEWAKATGQETTGSVGSAVEAVKGVVKAMPGGIMTLGLVGAGLYMLLKGRKKSRRW